MYRSGVPRVVSTQSVCKSGTVLVPVQVALKAKSKKYKCTNHRVLKKIIKLKKKLSQQFNFISFI